MPNSLDIRVQKLFVTVLFLKVLSSFLSWYFQFPWSLGFAVPLLLMTAYIFIGLKRGDDDVTDEKFADTCYYLGFIFTITSIIFALFDLPNIGTRIQDIAVRFGAAMVSTVLGLGVRVYLVSFRKDVADAIRDAEDAVLDANRKFTEQLTIALEKLRSFETQVDDAARTTVERVNLQVEALSKNHADKLTEFFVDLTNRNQGAFTEALLQIKVVSKRLADSVDGYANVMRTNIISIESKVNGFADAVSARLKETTFPDDYFAKHLEAPLSQLKVSAGILADDIKLVSSEVGKSSKVLATALTRLNDKSEATEGVLESVLKLSEQQRAALSLADAQLTTLEKLTATLTNFDVALVDTLSSFEGSRTTTAKLTEEVSALVRDGNQARLSQEMSFGSVIEKLDMNATATRTVAERLESNSNAATLSSMKLAGKLDAGVEATRAVAVKLSEAASATELVAVNLESLGKSEGNIQSTLTTIGKNGTEVVGRIDHAIEHLQSMVSQFGALDSALRSQSLQLNKIVDSILEAKVAALMPPGIPPELDVQSLLAGTSNSSDLELSMLPGALINVRSEVSSTSPIALSASMT